MLHGKKFMIIAGEVSGDYRAAELVRSIRRSAAENGEKYSPVFFGAGGDEMVAAGVDIKLKTTSHAIIGLLDAARNVAKFLGFIKRLADLAEKERPDAVIFVDSSGQNLRVADRIRHRLTELNQLPCNSWRPKLIYYVSPQVWASRAGRAKNIEENIDLMLCIFPFEKDWYAKHAPSLKTEFVGYPLLDRYLTLRPSSAEKQEQAKEPLLVLLPGSRKGELRKHIPVMAAAAKLIRAKQPIRLCMILPNDELKQIASELVGGDLDMQLRVGGQAEVLAEADLAITKSGTITLECALFGLQAVVIYIASRVEYEIGKRWLVKVKHLAMPNIIADETVYPELLQHEATGENIARQALYFLDSADIRGSVRKKLKKVVESLGEPGAANRAASHVWDLLAE